MNAADIIGWAKDGDAYCPYCKPVGTEDEVNPIFGQEVEDFLDYPCGNCGELIAESDEDKEPLPVTNEEDEQTTFDGDPGL